MAWLVAGFLVFFAIVGMIVLAFSLNLRDFDKEFEFRTHEEWFNDEISKLDKDENVIYMLDQQLWRELKRKGK